MTGIYKIINLINNKIYIGQAIDIRTRFRKHEKYDTPEKFNGSLSFEQEKNMPIHQAIMKYGLKNFKFEIIEECHANELNDREKFYIKLYNSKAPNGYNLQDGGMQWGGIKGELNHLTVYSEKDINEIKKRLLNGEKPINIVKFFPNIKIDTIYSINEGKSWRDNSLNYPLNQLKGNAKYSAEILNQIRQEFNILRKQEIGKMEAYQILADEYHYCNRSIMRIVKNEIYI